VKSALFTFHTKFTGLTVSKVEVHFSLFTFPAKIGHLEGKVELHFALKMTDQKVRYVAIGAFSSLPHRFNPK